METNTPTIENMMISANCNTLVNSIALNKTASLIAYTAANSVLIMDPYHINGNIPKVLFSLRGHSERVNGVMWLTSNTLVSISADRSLIIWSFTGEPRDHKNWNYKRVYESAHEQSINYLKTYHTQNEHYILTMCSAGTLKLWQGKSTQDISYKDELIFGKNL